MTSNQINYAKLREEQRHNFETERQGRDTIVIGQRNAAAGELQAAAAARNANTNAINAATRKAELLEAGRHNYALEAIQQSGQDEAASHNHMMESVSLLNAQTEQQRVTETSRHNKAAERLQFLHDTASLLGESFKLGKLFGASGFGDKLFFDSAIPQIK